jgi:hypothetical protein
MNTRAAFARFRVFFWVLTAGIVGMYVYGLALGIYAPLELGLLSFLCLGLLVGFSVHEILLHREQQANPQRTDRADKERRGW